MDQVRIGYGKNLVEYDPQLPFYVKLPPLKRMPLIPFEEAKTAALQIYESMGTPPTLCLSGGLDSECMALAFLAAEVPFNAATLKFADGLNSHDIQNAVNFCESKNIAHDLIELDIVKFFKSGEYRPYVKKYFCHTPELAAQLWFLDHLAGPFVWAGEAFRIFPGNDNPAIQSVSEFEAVFFRYVKMNNLTSVPNFHFYSSELAWSFFKLSLQTNYKSFENDHSQEHYLEKLDFYCEAGFPLSSSSERSSKLHGFEQVKIYFDDELRGSGETYNERYRIPTASEFPMAKNTYVDILKSDIIAKKILS